MRKKQESSKEDKNIQKKEKKSAKKRPKMGISQSKFHFGRNKCDKEKYYLSMLKRDGF